MTGRLVTTGGWGVSGLKQARARHWSIPRSITLSAFVNCSNHGLRSSRNLSLVEHASNSCGELPRGEGEISDPAIESEHMQCHRLILGQRSVTEVCDRAGGRALDLWRGRIGT